MSPPKKNRPLMQNLVLLILILAPGCSDAPDLRDQRLAEFAQRSLEEQSKQNDLIARQSQSVVEESQKLAEASKVLVERDAEARRELITAHEKLTSQLDEQRASIEANRDRLEEERKLLAKERHRDPIVAATIQSVGLIFAALLPLLVSVFVIVQMRRPEPDDAAVAELLVYEFTAETPRLLPGPTLLPPTVTTAAHVGHASESTVDYPDGNETARTS